MGATEEIIKMAKENNGIVTTAMVGLDSRVKEGKENVAKTLVKKTKEKETQL